MERNRQKDRFHHRKRRSQIQRDDAKGIDKSYVSICVKVDRKEENVAGDSIRSVRRFLSHHESIGCENVV